MRVSSSLGFGEKGHATDKAVDFVSQEIESGQVKALVGSVWLTRGLFFKGAKG